MVQATLINPTIFIQIPLDINYSVTNYRKLCMVSEFRLNVCTAVHGSKQVQPMEENGSLG